MEEAMDAAVVRRVPKARRIRDEEEEEGRMAGWKRAREEALADVRRQRSARGLGGARRRRRWRALPESDGEEEGDEVARAGAAIG